MKNRTQGDLKAWRELAQHHMPDWRPTLPQLQHLDEGPHDLGVALRSITRGWGRSDARWDVLLAVLEYYKREHAHELAEQIRQWTQGDGGAPEYGSVENVLEAADFIDPKKQPTTSEEPTP